MAEEAQDIVKAFTIGNTRVKISDACCRNCTEQEVAAILARIAERAQREINAAGPPQMAQDAIEPDGREKY